MKKSTSLVAMIITPDPRGTELTIDPLTPKFLIKEQENNVSTKKDFHFNKRRDAIKNLDIPEYRKAHNEYFDENIFVKGKFNRLVLFDARVWHGALGYYGTNDDDTRMTIVTQLHSVLATDSSGRSVSLPIPRSKRSSEI